MSVINREQVLPFEDDAEVVLRMLTDVGFYRGKYDALGFKGISVEEDAEGQKGFTVLARYQAAADMSVPKWAQRVLPQQVHVQQKDHWDVGTGRGTLEIRVGNVPVDITASMQLTASDGGCVNRLDWHFACTVPLLGKRIADFVADDVCAKAERDHAYVLEAIAQYR